LIEPITGGEFARVVFVPDAAATGVFAPVPAAQEVVDVAAHPSKHSTAVGVVIVNFSASDLEV
jgi:hypothetical protein